MTKRQLIAADSKAVAKLHLGAFKGFFLTSLGQGFLEEFYKAIIKHPMGISIGLFEGDKLYAFAIGTTSKAGFYSSLIKKNFLTLGFSALPALIKKPSKTYRLFKSLTTNDNSVKMEDSACLLSICTDPDEGGRGLGRQALQYFETFAFKEAKTICLTTDEVNNDAVNKFYQLNNYNLQHVFLQGDRRMNYYLKNIDQ